MYAGILNAIIDELRPGQVLRDVSHFWGFRSTVPGTGLSAASRFLAERYREAGLQAEVIAYPADDRTDVFHGRKNPLAWAPRSARLSVAEPASAATLVCDYANEPLCLICNSTATAAGGITARVVVVPAADREESYDGRDVAGAIVLTDQFPSRVEPHARKLGAVGIVSDCVSPPWLVGMPPVREPEDTPDLVLWTIFSGRHYDDGLWGFNLSPRQGRRLRALVAEHGGDLRLHAEVNADLSEGTSDLVSALLPGTDPDGEEVWLLGHSSEPGAEDNASGCCLGVEIARVLKALIDAGRLPPPRRGIRFLHGVEIDGYLPYLAEHHPSHVIGALALDAVGYNLALSGGHLELYRSPEENASFADALLERLFSAVAAEPTNRFTADNFACFAWRTNRYWGNDAFIGEGFFDVPTTQMSTWPERFYHSSQDTPDKLSDNTLGRSGAIAAAYVYLLAAAGEREALWMARLAAADWKRRSLDALAAASETEGADAAKVMALGRHLGYQARDAVESVMRLARASESLAAEVGHLHADATAYAAHEAVGVARHLPASPESPLSSPARQGEGRVVRPLRWRMPSDGDFSEAGKPRLTALHDDYPGLKRVWPWLNGRRTLGAMWHRLQYGGAVPWEAVRDYAELMVAEGFAADVEPKE